MSWTGTQPNGAHAASSNYSTSIVFTQAPTIPAPSRLIYADVAVSLRPEPREEHMDVRNIRDIAPIVEHNGTVPVWWMVPSREMKDTTEGGFLELVNEFEVAGGGYVEPHSHPTHEYYYVMSGRGIMRIEDDEREIGQGDLCTSRPTRSTPCARRRITPRSTASASPSESRAPDRSTTRTIDYSAIDYSAIDDSPSTPIGAIGSGWARYS